MIRKIIHIDRDKCNGCGACARACHEGAIDIIDGKAVLVREHFCDGLGDCLPACPTDAITFEEREAPAYDEAAVQRAQKLAQKKPFSGCPGMRAKQFQRSTAPAAGAACPSQLSQWPVQIKLAGVMAPYFDDADLLIAADCTAYAYGNFHEKFIRGRITLIGDFCGTFHSQCHCGTNGSALLRRYRTGSAACHCGKRKSHFLSRNGDRNRRNHSGGEITWNRKCFATSVNRL